MKTITIEEAVKLINEPTLITHYEGDDVSKSLFYNGQSETYYVFKNGNVVNDSLLLETAINYYNEL